MWIQQEQKEWKYEESVEGGCRIKEKEVEKLFQKELFWEIFYLRGKVEGGFDTSLSFPSQEVKLKFCFRYNWSIFGNYF